MINGLVNAYLTMVRSHGINVTLRGINVWCRSDMTISVVCLHTLWALENVILLTR